MITVGGLLLGTLLATPAPTAEANAAPGLSDPFDAAVVTVAAAPTLPPIRDPFTPARRRANKRPLATDRPLRDPFAASHALGPAPDSPLRDPFAVATQAPNLAPRPRTEAPPLVDPFAS